MNSKKKRKKKKVSLNNPKTNPLLLHLKVKKKNTIKSFCCLMIPTLEENIG